MQSVSQREAIRLAGKVPRPLNKRKPYWNRMRKVLKALCKYLPQPYPGMRRLSDDTGIPYSVVQRLLAEAEGLGLIARVARGHGYAYRMTFLDDPVSDPVTELTGYEESEALRRGLRPLLIAPVVEWPGLRPGVTIAGQESVVFVTSWSGHGRVSSTAPFPSTVSATAVSQIVTS